MPELILTLAAAVVILAVGLVALCRAGKPGADDDDTAVVYAHAESALILAISMLLDSRREWAEAARRPGKGGGRDA